MKNLRISLAIEDGGLNIPDTGVIAVLRPTADHDLSVLPADQIRFSQSFYPDHKALTDCGFASLGDEHADMAFVCPTRSKVESRGLITQACELTPNGIVVVDGLKTEGIESLYKEVRKRTDILGMLSKAHGRIFWFAATDVFADWTLKAPAIGTHGFSTTPGIFSPDAIDKGSAVLLDHMPTLKGRVADLGAGWGLLSAHLAKQSEITELHLIEAEEKALACARLNVTDARAQFHWADATDIRFDTPFRFVVSNPPFHTSRAADPDIGRAFIRSAATLLSPSGTFIMVANRHLPYEAALSETFKVVTEIGGTSGFKVLQAQRPSRAAR